MYKILIRSQRGHAIDESEALTFKDAKARAEYMIGDAYAQGCGTTHDLLGSHEVEVVDAGGSVVWVMQR